MTQDGIRFSRRDAMQTLALGAATLAFKDALAAPAPAPAASEHNPGAKWEFYAKPQDAGFADDLSKLSETLYPLSTTAFMIVRGGKVAYSYGHLGLVSYLASSRKSIMSMLYGKYVANGTIKLDTTLGELGIDDDQGLLPIEKTATIRHVLMASSGVYHPAGSPGGSENGPKRGSMKPGENFLYNNWDFNVAGAIFQQLTGKSVHQAFADDLAGPLQLEDFDLSRQRMMGYVPRRSKYLGYHFFLSGRDMARLGLCMINGGKWNGKEVVPASWVKESTTMKVPGSKIAGDHSEGYAYLWWIPTESRKSPQWVGSYAAQGNYGQYIVCLPALDMVVVHRRAVTDEFAIARNVGTTKASPAGGEVSILPIVDQIVASLRA